VGACDAGTDQRVARNNGACRLDHLRLFGEDLSPLDPRTDLRLNEGTQLNVLDCAAEGLRGPNGGIHDCEALLRRGETQPTLLLIR
jgi:hypothetical protein